MENVEPKTPQINKEPVLKKLMKFFKIGLNKNYDKVAHVDKIKPLEKIATSDVLKPVDFPKHVDEFYRHWMNDCHASAERYKGMVNVWEDMDLLYYNNVLIKRAIDLMTDEVIQADLNPEYIGIEASPKVKDYLLEFHDRISLYSKIRPAVEDTVQYGNTGWIISESENSIEEIIQPDIYDFKDILQFSPIEIDKLLKNKDKFFMQYSAQERIEKLINSILDKDNYGSYFNKYILGYQIGDYVLPPWKFLHFKNATSKSPFDPYGVPTFIHSVSAYKQYDSAMTLQMILRSAKIPIEKYDITAPNVIDPVSKVKIVTDFMRQIQNSGFSTTRKEEKGIGETIFTVKDMFDYDLIVPDIDIDEVKDIEMLENALIVSTGTPRNLIDPNDTGFGDSGLSLIEKFKPYARQIYRQQSIVLENVTQLDKIQMILSGKFSEEDMNFILTMPYPESQTNSEIIDSQSSLIDLVDKTIELLSTRFLNGEPVPEDLIYVVMSDMLPYSQDKIDQWMKYLKQSKVSNVEDVTGSIYSEIAKQFHKRKNKDLIKEVILKQKVKYLKQGVKDKNHYFSSSNKYPAFKAELLNEWSIEDTKQIFNEEIKKVVYF